MNSTSPLVSSISSESWLIPLDILMLVCAALTILLSILFLLIVIIDKTCHTVPMMLVGSSSFALILFGCSMFGAWLFTLTNDLKEIDYEDSLCSFRAYMVYSSGTAMNFSFSLQAFYRYVVVVYPSRLYWQTRRTQIFLMCLAWTFSFGYYFPFLFTGDILYNIANQTCQLPLRLAFPIIYLAFCSYLIPDLITIFIYFRLVLYVKEMSKRVTVANSLFRARRELKMVGQTLTLTIVLITLGFPYLIFFLISFFTSPLKYHFRIAITFIDASMMSVISILFNFTEPVKTSLMKRFKQ